MKSTKLFSLIALFLGMAFISNVAFAGEIKTSKIQTSAYSWMCKNKIETEVKDMDGVTECNLDLENKIVEVKFDVAKVTLEKINEKIQNLGYTAEIMTESKNSDKVQEGKVNKEGKESGKTGGANNN